MQTIGTHEQLSIYFLAIGHANANSTWKRLVTDNSATCLDRRTQGSEEPSVKPPIPPPAITII